MKTTILQDLVEQGYRFPGDGTVVTPHQEILTGREIGAFADRVAPNPEEAAAFLSQIGVQKKIPVQIPSVSSERLEFPSRGGVMIKTSAGWIQLGVPMWTNKDAFDRYAASGGFGRPKDDVPQIIPTTYIYDAAYNQQDGFLPFDFLGYMHFVTKGTTFNLVTADPSQAEALKAFLDLSYQGDRRQELSESVRQEYPADAVGVPDLRAEMERAFVAEGKPAIHPEALRTVSSFNANNTFQMGNVSVINHSNQVYEIVDQGESLGVVDLKIHPMPKLTLERSLETARDKDFQDVRAQAMVEGRPGLWPLGTGYGFDSKGETSGFMNWHNGRVTLIDPPSNTLEYFLSNGIPLDLISGIIVTHGHTDHFGNSIPRLLGMLPKVPVYTTPTIYKMLLEQSLLAFSLPTSSSQELLQEYYVALTDDFLIPDLAKYGDGSNLSKLDQTRLFVDLYEQVTRRLTEKTTPALTKLQMHLDQDLASIGCPGLFDWDFKPVYPQTPTVINGQTYRFDYTLHTIPALGFEITTQANRDEHKNPVLYFSGDTYAVDEIRERLTQSGPNGETPVMNPERANQILRMETLLSETKGQTVPLTVLQEAGFPPIHTPGDQTRQLLDRLQETGVDVSGVKLYHVADDAAAKAGVPKWLAGHRGWIDLSGHYPDWEALTYSDLVDSALQRIPVLASLTHPQIGTIFGNARNLTLYKSGHVIFERGTQGDEFIIIIDGEVAIDYGTGTPMKKQSGFIGEAALFNETRNATVTATVPTYAIKVSAAATRAQLEASGVISALSHIRSVRAQAYPAFAASPWGHLPKEIADGLFLKGSVEYHEPGRQFITQGDPARDVYVVLNGQAQIHRDGRLLSVSHPSDIIGEMALIHHAPRMASAMAGPNGTHVLRLDAQRLTEFQHSYPGVGGPLRRLAMERARSNHLPQIQRFKR